MPRIRIRIWDWPTRLIHWLLVALVFFSWGSAEYGHLDLHRYSGYTVLGLLAFRLYWGFFGSATARFANFVKGPGAVLDYIREQRASNPRALSEPRAYSLQPGASAPGHNPLGGWSVVALFALLITQVALGLFAVDIDGLESGPLSYLVSFDMGRACAKTHRFVFNTLLVLVALHIAAILFYLVLRRDNLILPMITGKKSVPTSDAQVDAAAPFLRVALGLIIAAAVVWAIV